jgi:NADH-quinone oxidoreductase subunit D
MSEFITKITSNQPVFEDNDPQDELITLNIGPTHPATHGVFQNVVQIDGERIVSGVSTIGYIHRAFEKIAEHRPFYQITPLTDRLNYCSAPHQQYGLAHDG